MQTTTDEPTRASDDGMVRRPAWFARCHSFRHAGRRVGARCGERLTYNLLNEACGEELPSLFGKVSEERHQLRCL